jgi:NADPH:quinone reductase-like Zn-dependent oxidoreductase
VDPDLLVQKSATFSRPVVFAYLSSPAQRQERTQRLWAALADGSIHAPVIERYTLDAAAEAHARLESRQSVGPLILVA